jgi:hypothetical protein
MSRVLISLHSDIGGMSILHVLPYHVYVKRAIELHKSHLRNRKSFQIRYENRGQVTSQLEPINSLWLVAAVKHRSGQSKMSFNKNIEKIHSLPQILIPNALLSMVPH